MMNVTQYGFIKKRLVFSLALVIAVPCLYAAGFWNSLRKIDSFCNSIDTGTRVSQLSPLAHEIGVDLRGPFEYPENSGEFVAISASAFTVGEYKCRIKANAVHVTSKYLGYE